MLSHLLQTCFNIFSSNQHKSWMFLEFDGLFFGFVKQIENVHKNIIHRRQNLSSFFFLPLYEWSEVWIQITLVTVLQKQTLVFCVLS